MKERKKKFLTPSGLEVKAHYGARPRDSREEGGRLDERSGEYPYTRGIHEAMYRSRRWTMRQYAGFGTAKETNERYKLLLARGSSGLSVAFDLPTQMGRDPDHSLARGEVGKVGVSLATLADMRELLDGIPLEEVSLSMTINSTAAILLSFLLAVAEERGIPFSKIRGTTQNDILKEYIARGTYIFPPEGALQITTDMFSFCTQHVPQWNTISISGYHIREAGSTAVQELAFTFANAIAYVEAALSQGLSLDSFANRLAFFFNGHSDFLEEIAKFRAARRIWAKIMKERFGAQEARSMMLRFHTQTAGSTLTAQQPMNNVVRTTVQALAAVLGGTQSLHTNGFDEALGLPTEESATLALRTQQVLAEEAGVDAAVDPFGGSYLMEEWTDRFEREVFAELERIDALGGMVSAIAAHYPQDAIEKAAYEHQRALEKGERRVVGVNAYEEEEHRDVPVLKVDPKKEEEQKEKLGRVRSERDGEVVQQRLRAVVRAAKGGDPLLPEILSAVKANATLGEISDALRSVFGEYRS